MKSIFIIKETYSILKLFKIVNKLQNNSFKKRTILSKLKHISY